MLGVVVALAAQTVVIGILGLALVRSLRAHDATCKSWERVYLKQKAQIESMEGE